MVHPSSRSRSPSAASSALPLRFVTAPGMAAGGRAQLRAHPKSGRRLLTGAPPAFFVTKAKVRKPSRRWHFACHCQLRSAYPSRLHAHSSELHHRAIAISIEEEIPLWLPCWAFLLLLPPSAVCYVRDSAHSFALVALSSSCLAVASMHAVLVRFWLQLLSFLCCVAVATARVVGRRLGEPSSAGDAMKAASLLDAAGGPLGVAAAATAVALAAQLLLDWNNGIADPLRKVEAPEVPKPIHPAEVLTLREDGGATKAAPLYPQPPKALASAPLPKFTMAEVAKHCTREDCWVVLDSRAYDVTRFISKHPGGVGPVVNMAGKDATDVFDNYHAARVYKHMLPQYLVGEVTDCVVYPHVADFRAARQEMLRRGLFETDYRYYAKHGCWLAFLFTSARGLSLGSIGSGSAAMRMLGAAVMGICWQQMAGLGHDRHAGTHNFHTDHIIGSLMSACMGLGRLMEVRPQHTSRRLQRGGARSEHPAHAHAGDHRQDL